MTRHFTITSHKDTTELAIAHVLHTIPTKYELRLEHVSADLGSTVVGVLTLLLVTVHLMVWATPATAKQVVLTVNGSGRKRCTTEGHAVKVPQVSTYDYGTWGDGY